MVQLLQLVLFLVQVSLFFLLRIISIETTPVASSIVFSSLPASSSFLASSSLPVASSAVASSIVASSIVASSTFASSGVASSGVASSFAVSSSSVINGTFSVSYFSAVFNSPPATGNISFVKNTITGQVTLSFKLVQVLSSTVITTSFFGTGSAQIPTTPDNLRPLSTLSANINCINGGISSIVPGSVLIQSTGEVTISLTSGTFVNSALIGYQPFNISYLAPV